MSKQQSFSPDANEVSQKQPSVRKDKRWAVWMKLVVNKDHPWRKTRLHDWWRRGRYATIEQAEEFVERDKRKFGWLIKYEYVVRADELGKPE